MLARRELKDQERKGGLTPAKNFIAFYAFLFHNV